MSDFLTMQERIRREIRRDGLTAEIKASIATAIEDHENERFWFNEAEASAQTTTGQANYAFTTDFLEIDFLELSSSSSETLFPVRTDYLSVKRINQDSETPSEPDVWSVFQDNIWFAPPPDFVYEMRAFGHTKLTEVTASASGAATNAWMTDGERLIRLEAKADLFENRLRNSVQADRQRLLARIALNDLRTGTTKRKTRNKVRKTVF